MKSKSIFSVSEFAIFFQKSYEGIFTFIERYIGDSLAADDLAQDTFLKVYEKRGSFENQLHAKSFAYVVARNLSLDYIKHQKIKGIYAAVPQEEEDNSFFQQIAYVETVNTVRNALAALTERSRQVIELSMDGNSNEEIADALGISINTVKTLKKRSYHKLRELLANNYKSLLLVCAILLALCLLLF